jgi:prepilin-type processing-associated H-X9-DG protein
MKQLGLAVLNYESGKDVFPVAFRPNWPGNNPTGNPPCGTDTTGSCNSITDVTICQKLVDLDGDGNFNELETKHSLQTFMLSFLERQTVYLRVALKSDWNNNGNNLRKTSASITVPGPMRTDISEFICPTAESRPEKFTTDYTVMVDIDDDAYCTDVEDTGLARTRRNVDSLVGMLTDKAITTSSVSDGLSHTIMFVESAGRPFYYEKGEFICEASETASDCPPTTSSDKFMTRNDWAWGSDEVYSVFGGSPTADKADCGITSVMNCDNFDQIYSFHSGGANIVFGDGSVNFLNESIDVDVIISMITRGANDTVESL